MGYKLYQTDGVTPVTLMDFGKISPRTNKVSAYTLKNEGSNSLIGIYARFYTEIEKIVNTTGSPIRSAKVLRADGAAQLYKTSLLRENVNSLFIKETSPAILVKYHAETDIYEGVTGQTNIQILEAQNDKFLIGFHYPIKNIFIPGISVAFAGGSIVWKMSDSEGNFTPLTVTDGTSGLTAPSGGNIYFGNDIDVWAWGKIGIGNYSDTFFWLEISTPDAVTTPATIDSVELNHVYKNTNGDCAFIDNPVFYEYNDPDYTERTPAYSFGNRGIYIFDNDPVPDGVLRATYDRKEPQPKEYVFTFSGKTASIDGGSYFSIVDDGVTPNIIPSLGLSVVFNPVEDTSVGSVFIAEGIKYLSYHPDDSGNPSAERCYSDFAIGTIDAAQSNKFHVRIEPDYGMDQTKAYAFKPFCKGTIAT